MLGASCGLEVSETVLTKQRKSEETEKGMASASSGDASSPGVLTQSLGAESRQCSKSSTTWSKIVNSHSLVQLGSVLM